MSKKTNPVSYTSDVAVYVDGVVYKPGEPFVTDKPKGSTWTETDPVEAAAAAAGSPTPKDVDLNKLDVPALKALAAAKGIDIGQAKSKDDLITVVSAANEPTL